jgi:hypothetical protein
MAPTSQAQTSTALILLGSTFRDAVLIGTSFRDAQIEGTDFSGASLHLTDLRVSNLSPQLIDERGQAKIAEVRADLNGVMKAKGVSADLMDSQLARLLMPISNSTEPVLGPSDGLVLCNDNLNLITVNCVASYRDEKYFFQGRQHLLQDLAYSEAGLGFLQHGVRSYPASDGQPGLLHALYKASKNTECIGLQKYKEPEEWEEWLNSERRWLPSRPILSDER